jgi:hypothetical protein
MPGAYSVLFGVMGAEEVRDLGHHESSACRTASKSPQPAGAEDQPAYDRAFQPAIDAGQLSPAQAAERGKRDQYVLAIANRHGVPLSVAYDVADNRTSLLNSLRKQACDDSAGIELTVPPSPYRFLAWFGVAVSLGLVAMAFLYRTAPPVPRDTSENRSVLGAEVRMDDSGRVLSVAAANPRAVLTAYCASHPGPKVQPIDVVPSVRYGSDVRLGLFRESADDTRVFMIEISEDRSLGRWVAGNGAAPVVPKSIPPGALEDDKATRPRR